MSRISPVVLLVIVILAIVFFVFGLLHLLFRYIMKRPSFYSISQSNRYQDSSGSHALQRQLQQLFRLHDSGLDQSLIDALPVFCYKELMGSKEPFDCAVCLCEFSDTDMLRLLPMCSHAFHIHCIDTWLLSNSTCPLCRGLISSGLPIDNPLFNYEESREQWSFFRGDGETEFSSSQKAGIVREDAGDMRIFSVRLGKYKSVNVAERGERDQGETSTSCSLDARRCYSMGAFQYVVGESDLQVALSGNNGNPGSFKLVRMRRDSGNFVPNADREGKKISARTRGDSFSVSKIWLWSKKSKFPGLSDTNFTNSTQTSVDVVCQ